MPLSNADKKRYRQIGHSLNPVVTIAQKGLSETIREELERALAEHELIKVKIVADRDEKKVLAAQICADFNAECVQSIGHVILLFRAARKPDPKLSNLVRHKNTQA
ncbi:MAG: ribosome assembly RNA-binding protein YhbY [Pseudohongiellaceae bacterium]|jgi:RNA-binding protein